MTTMASQNELETLTQMFPTVSKDVCQLIYENSACNMDDAITALLEMSDPQKQDMVNNNEHQPSGSRNVYNQPRMVSSIEPSIIQATGLNTFSNQDSILDEKDQIAADEEFARALEIAIQLEEADRLAEQQDDATRHGAGAFSNYFKWGSKETARNEASTLDPVDGAASKKTTAQILRDKWSTFSEATKSRVRQVYGQFQEKNKSNEYDKLTADMDIQSDSPTESKNASFIDFTPAQSGQGKSTRKAANTALLETTVFQIDTSTAQGTSSNDQPLRSPFLKAKSSSGQSLCDKLKLSGLFPEGASPRRIYPDPINPEKIYVVGTTVSSFDNQMIPMEEDIMHGTTFGFITQMYAVNGSRVWTRICFGDDEKYDSYVYDVTVDSDGYAYVAGEYYSQSSTNTTAFVRKFGYNGDLIWYKPFSPTPPETNAVKKARTIIVQNGRVVTAGHVRTGGRSTAFITQLNNSTGFTVGSSLWSGSASIASLVQNVEKSKTYVVGHYYGDFFGSYSSTSDIFYCELPPDLSTCSSVVHMNSTLSDHIVTRAVIDKDSNQLFIVGTLKKISMAKEMLFVAGVRTGTDAGVEFETFGDSSQTNFASSVVAFSGSYLVVGYTYGVFGTNFDSTGGQQGFVAQYDQSDKTVKASGISRAVDVVDICAFGNEPKLILVYQDKGMMGYYFATFSPPLQFGAPDQIVTAYHTLTGSVSRSQNNPYGDPMGQVESFWRGMTGTTVPGGWVIFIMAVFALIFISCLGICTYACCNMMDAAPNHEREPLITNKKEEKPNQSPRKEAKIIDSIELQEQ